MADLTPKQELSRGFGDALSTAFELAVTPAILALIGWRIDAWLGTTPLFLLVFFAFTMSYEIWKLWKRYELQMLDQEAKVAGLRRRPGAGPGTTDGGAEP